jgi:formylmethanofuran dehydrogenase subunit C
VIRLALKSRPPTRLALDGIIPERLAGLSEVEIARLPLGLGNREGSLGDWFTVEGAAGEEERLVIADACDRLDRIGAGMTRGAIAVAGDVGAYAGLAMVGGTLAIDGSAGHGVAVAMQGGEIRIGGNVGDQLGGALPGERTGMREGRVVVAGSAGSGVGDRMHRGFIAVGGAAGSFCGARMAAGTIVVGGALGAHPGIAMRRGTIVALDGAPPVPASFAESGVHELAFARLLARALTGTGLDRLAPRLARLRRWAGDLAEGGRGEILAPPCAISASRDR